MDDYAAFVRDKFVAHVPSGIADGYTLPAAMFPHQVAITKWALKRGRAAVFCDTGLGKMLMELAFSKAVNDHTQRPVMIHTPLAVAAQLAAEGRRFGIEATVVREAHEVTPGINIANYERLHKFDTAIFGGVVLDESGCIKHHDAKTFRALTEAYRDTPFKLPATATPAPNDWTELGTHAEFLGICTRAEMLAEFFIHDGGDTSVWRLKGHARAIFWRWVASWGAMIRKPSDLGFDDGAYNLPPLTIHEHTVDSAAPLNGMLFAMEAQTLSERRDARRGSLDARTTACFQEVITSWGNQDPGTGPIITLSTKSDAAQISARPMQDTRPHEMRLPSAAKKRPTRKSCEPTIAPTTPQTSSDTKKEAPNSTCESTASTRPSSSECLKDKEDSAAYARSPRNQIECSTSITTMQLALSEGSSATHAISRSAASRTSPIHPGLNGKPEQSHTLLEPWIIWVELNAEQDALELAFGDLAFSVRGANTTEEKEAGLAGWLAGERPVMLSKPSILGYGINMQMCKNMAFVGVTDSFEAYYQSVRRVWRFGQKRPVDVHLFSSSQEGAVAANLKRKERDAKEMAESMSTETHDAVFVEVIGEARRETNAHDARKRVTVPSFLEA